MSICASGASTTKPNVPAAIVVDQAYVQSLMPPLLAWLFPYLPYAKTLVIGDVSAFCAADPPTFSVPTPLELLNFITGGNLNDYLVVREFIDNVIRAYLWHQICQCTTGATPAAPAAPSPPVGLPAVNPPSIVTGPTTTPCLVSPHAASNAAAGSGLVVANQPALTGRGFTWQTYNVVTSVFSGTYLPMSWQFTYYNAGGTVANHIVPMNTAGTFAGTFPVPITADNFQITWTTGAGSGVTHYEFDASFFCGTNVPGTPESPCCPPDQQLTGLINQILQLATLIQRQAVPFGYVYGTNHTALTGNGSISVADLIGVSVDVTTLPGSYGVAAGTPEELFELGFITLGTTDGYETSRRIDHDGTLMLPPGAGVFTTIGYTLRPGVVVAIRELVREP